MSKVNSNGEVVTGVATPTSSTSLQGYAAYTASQVATTLVTVPAGNTFIGEIGAQCDVGVAAASTTAGQALAVFTTAGANAFPAAGSVFDVEARCGANAATGTVGSQGSASGSRRITVIAPAGNAVTIQVTTTQAGTASRCSVWANGTLYT